VIDDGTVSRLGDETFRWTAADPSLRWFRQNAVGLDVEIEDVSEQVAALAVQGPTSARLLRAAGDIDLDTLKYFRVTRGRIGDVPVDVSRTGYTGDLGYEVWMPWERAGEVWDRLVTIGRAHDAKPAGMLALDVARIEAGLLLVDIDFHGSRKVSIDQQRYTPDEMGLGRLVSDGKAPFIGRDAIAAERVRGHARQVVGLEISWADLEGHYTRIGLTPQVPIVASRVAVPVYKDGRQVGKATSTTWSPVVKKLIALATIDRPHFAPGSSLEIEVTVEAVRHRARATVVPTPFYNPPQKTATPPL
jgi:aminomethyltransferase